MVRFGGVRFGRIGHWLGVVRRGLFGCWRGGFGFGAGGLGYGVAGYGEAR